VLPFTVPQAGIEEQLEAWIQGIIKSNDNLVTALERLRASYNAMRAGKLVTNADQILAQVETALTEAARAKNVV
jgi:hypothetical protein